MSNFAIHPLGFIYRVPGCLVFLGNKHATSAALAAAFPEVSLVVLKQMHSDRVAISVPGDAGRELAQCSDADAHVTAEKGLALGVRTADCMPLLIQDPSSGVIAGIHAGWRGIENEIIIKTCETMQARGANLRQARAWIGPHIGVASFETAHDVAEKLELRNRSGHTAIRQHADAQKAYVDLLQIARAQLSFMNVRIEAECIRDTMTDVSFASFRRERENAGRQVSFIAQLR